MEIKLNFEEKIYFSLFSIITLTFVFYLIDKFSLSNEEINYGKEGLKDIGQQIRDSFERPIKQSIEATKRNIDRSNNAIKNGFERGFNKVKQDAERSFNKVKQDTEKGFNKIKNDTEKGFNKIKDDTEKGFNKLKNDTEKGFNQIKNGVEGAFNKIKNTFENAFKQIADFFNKIKEVFVFLGSVFKWTFDHVSCGITWITNFRYCFFWYFLEIIGKILYLPVTLFVWITRQLLGFDLRPFVDKFWEYLSELDCLIFSIAGFHIIHYPSDVIAKCYSCEIREFPKFNVKF